MTRKERLPHFAHLVAAVAMFTAVAVVAGCARPAPSAPPKRPLDVSVVLPLIHKVTKSEDFTGRTEPFRYVEIRPQVTGELDKVFFKDGDNVWEGDELFEIDKRIYVAQRNNASAAVAKAKAGLAQARADLERAQAAYDKKVMAQGDYDAAVANRDAGIASVQAAEAALELAEQNLAWTRITARYSGRLSMRRVDPGNIVTANTTALTTLIVLDPMYIGFDIDEQALERRREAIKAGEVPTASEETLLVQVGLGHQEGYPYYAKVTFADNQLDPSTGTLHIRAEIENPPLRLASLPAVVGSAAALDAERKSLRLLSPNMFVRVRFPLGRPYEALLVREEAIGSDQGHKYVYVMNDSNMIEYRRVKPGPLYRPDDPNDTRVFRAIGERKPNTPKGEGGARGERVVFGGQQRIKEGDTVNPKLLPQKSLDGQ
jgi:membrane fusion protein, multidrug efflux system